jgi:hypothetical protein
MYFPIQDGSGFLRHGCVFEAATITYIHVGFEFLDLATTYMTVDTEV